MAEPLAQGSFALLVNVKDFTTDVKDTLRKAVLEALKTVAEALLSDSRAYVPVLTGDLLRSGRVEVIRHHKRFGTDQVRVVYGREQVIIYAETQHEDPYNHPSLGFFGAAKYLTQPWQANLAFYQALFELVLFREMRRAA